MRACLDRLQHGPYSLATTQVRDIPELGPPSQTMFIVLHFQGGRVWTSSTNTASPGMTSELPEVKPGKATPVAHLAFLGRD